MGKIKDAVIRAQETADITDANEALLWRASAALSQALDDPQSDGGKASAERALALINTYLLETELCKQ